MPSFTINRDCLLKDNKGSVINDITWSTNSTDTCFIDDIAAFNLYFKKNILVSNYTKIVTITDLSQRTYRHIPDSGFTGCYILTAVDKNNNESVKAGEICLSNCSLEYDLPNSFTPNGDGQNDIFTPRINAGVIKVKFEVFNRWGELLYRTEDPSLNWDGKDLNNKEISDGVYYYVCKVFGFPENSGQVLEDRKGFIQVIR
jgi:gliding motility-associated-like protein